MAGYVRLQELTSVGSGTTTQQLEDAIDLGDFGSVVVQVRKAQKAAELSYLFLQQAPILDEQAFEDVLTFSLCVSQTMSAVICAPMRYLRWRCEVASGGTAQFQIDAIGRET